MAADYISIINNLTAFYPFTGKSVIHVGAGGGQLIAYARETKHVLAVDSDLNALERLNSAIASQRLQERFTILHADFGPQLPPADVVLFEFCLHEIDDAESALATARQLAPDVVVIDHAPGSPWVFYTAETNKVRNSWAVVDSHHVRRRSDFATTQRFADVDELLQKVSVVGEPAISRARALSGQSPIEIEMTYRAALL
ncbi:MAG TPA: class I SAM-dependent methyltransferase [Terriglobales bacterium]|nr:class I SAM-dependent methyltransferase [Terriglobales bacterium]